MIGKAPCTPSSGSSVRGPGGKRSSSAPTGRGGDWARLFRRGEGYLGTELLRDAADPGRYLTLDRWTSRAAWESFRAGHLAEYEAIDRLCEALTAAEARLGDFDGIDPTGPAEPAEPARSLGSVGPAGAADRSGGPASG